MFIIAPCVAGAAIDVALTVADNWLSGRKTTLGDIAGSAVSGCVAGYVGAGLGKALKWLGERALRWLGKGDDVIRWLDDAAEAACSFPADTAVATPSGSELIGDVDVGDRVLAYDPATGDTQARAVTAVSVHRDRAITRVLVDGETVVTTPDHPFLTVDRGWVNAGDLRPGERLVSATGHRGAVFAVITHPDSADMWDLTVATTHTFAVGQGGWVVHNCAADDLNSTLERIKQGIKDPHGHDGTEFFNREGLLPDKPSGYYKLYVHRTPGVLGPGRQRLVIGSDGDVWFTPDHYETFTRIR